MSENKLKLKKNTLKYFHHKAFHMQENLLNNLYLGQELNWKAEIWRLIMSRGTLMLFIYHQQEKHNADLVVHCLLHTENAEYLHWNPSI